MRTIKLEKIAKELDKINNGKEFIVEINSEQIKTISAKNFPFIQEKIYLCFEENPLVAYEQKILCKKYYPFSKKYKQLNQKLNEITNHK